MLIGVSQERFADERRVALVPADIPKLVKAGHTVLVETEAGLRAGYTDAQYSEKGATIVKKSDEILSKADIVLAIRAGAADPSNSAADAAQLRNGQVLIANMDPYQAHASFAAYKSKGVSAFALELIPRITRAQSMDVLSSQASLAGYKGALLAAEYLPKMFPMMMTAAGTIVPAKVFVLGAGVAGLQAIATAKRLGSVVSAYDVRPAVKEQVESLGAKFVVFDIGAAEGSGGYAKELTDEQKKRQQDLMNEYCKDMDVIISTAAVPGRPSPKLITEAMVKAMPAGSVIIDLASERGGNCELTEPGKTIVKHNVTIAGPLNVPSSLAYHASQLFSRNIVTLLGLLFDKEQKLTINTQDEIISACLVTHEGKAGSEKIASSLGI